MNATLTAKAPAVPARRRAVAPRPDPRPSLRPALRTVLVAWIFGACWAWTISGAAMNRFTRGIGAPEFAFGLLAALPHIGALFQFPGSVLIERYGGRRRVFLVLGTLGRLLWVAVAAIPWVLPVGPWRWPLMCVIVLASWICLQMTVPAWMNWMADVVPTRLRGRFFAGRSRMGQIIGIAATLSVGYALDVASAVEDSHPDLLLKVTSAILGIVGCLGALDILCFRRLQDDRPPLPAPHVDWRHLLAKPLGDPAFRRYLLYNFTLMLALGFIGQYIWQYSFDVLHLSNKAANILLIAIPLLVMSCSYGMWGRLIDRLGKRPVLIMGGVLTMGGALGWLMTTPEQIWLGYVICLTASLAWPGVEIANFNVMLDIAGRRGEGKGKSGGGSTYVAVNTLATALGGILSGILGAIIAATLRDWTWQVPGMAWGLTYHRVLLLISLVLRGVAVLLALRLHEPSAAGTRDAMHYLGTALYSNLVQGLLWPSRFVGRIGRWTYRIGPRG